MRQWCLPGLLPLVLVGAMAWSDAFGQTPPAPPLAESVDGAAAPDRDAAAGESAVTPEKPAAEIPGERIIYVPFKDLTGNLADPDANVLLPYQEYRVLLEAWEAAQRQTPPLNALIASANYTAVVQGDVARITAKFGVNVVGPGWSALPLTLGGAVGKVTAGEEVLLQGTGEGTYSMLFSKPGRYDVEIELSVKVTQSADGREFAFDCPPVAVAVLDLTVPKRDQAVEIQPQGVVEPNPQMEADETRVQTHLGATRRIAVKWHPEAGLQPEMNLLAGVTNETLITIEDGLVHTDAWLQYDILRGELEQVRVLLPKGHRILDIASDGRIRSWKTAEQGENQIVTVELLNPAKNKLTVELHTEYKLEGNELQAIGIAEGGRAHGIHPLDVVRESGQVAVRHASDLTVTVVEQQGAVRIDETEVAERLHGDNAYAFKYYSPNLVLKLAAKPVEPRLLVDHHGQFVFEDEELKLMSTVTYTVERAGIFELRLNIPEGVTIDTVECPGMREYGVAGTPPVLTVTLSERTLGAIPVIIKGHRELSADAEASLTLSLIEPTAVERETGTVSVFAKESIEVITDAAGLQGVQPLPVAQGARVGEAVLTSVWSFTRRPVTIPVRTVRKPTRLSANVATTIDVQPELTHVTTQLDYVVEYSATDTFRLQVPEAVSANLRIELQPGDSGSAPIKQKTAADPVDGQVVWTIVTQREVLGRQRFLIEYDRTPAAAAAGDPAKSKTVDVELVRPLGMVNAAGEATTPLTRVNGEVCVKKDRTLSITANVVGEGVERIDIRELKQIPTDGTLAYRYFRGGESDAIRLTVDSTTFDIQDVVSTVVSRSLVEIVTGEDAEATYRCRLLLKTSERQRLLIHLPVNLQVLGAFLNDREIKLEKAEQPAGKSPGENWTPFWVNVSRPESSDDPFLLTFQFLWTVNPTLGQSAFARGEMLLPLPVLGNVGGGITQELKVVVWVPEDYQLVGDPQDFQLTVLRRPWSVILGSRALHGTSRLDSWVTDGRNVPVPFAQFPTEGRVPYVYANLGGESQIQVTWWKNVPMTVFLSLVVAVAGLILLGTSWENKLGILFLAAFGCALYGLQDSHALSAGIAAAALGILVTLALWLVRTLLSIFKPAAADRPFPPKRTYVPEPVRYAVIPPPGVFDHLKPEA